MDRNDIVIATETASLPNRMVHKGERWFASDPLVKAYPGFFTKDASFEVQSSVPLGDDGLPAAAKKAGKGRSRGSRRARAAATETTTSAPGERRSRTITSPADEKAGPKADEKSSAQEPDEQPEEKPGPKADEQPDEKTSGK